MPEAPKGGANAVRRSGRAHSERRWWERVHGGQSLVELALVLPVLLFFGLACIQFAIIFKAYIDVESATRDATRWVVTHPHVLDTATVTTIEDQTPGHPRLPLSLTPARLSWVFNPACGTITSGKCTSGGTQIRNVGDNLTVTATYDITDLVFLPANLGWGSWTIRIPTTLPSYSITMQVEPS